MTASIYAINLSLTTTTITVNGNSMLVSDNAFEKAIEITSEEAGYIAELFITDMIESGTCCWDEDTEIVDVVTLYNENGTAATAHTVELTEGYVVISAFADSESLIPEWSDTAMPIYDNLDNDENGNIIYLGSYEYYVDSSDTTVTNLDGNTVNKSSLINYIEESRDISNVSASLIESCVVTPGALTMVIADPIVDPYQDAFNIYRETFVLDEFCNNWEQYFNTCYCCNSYTSDYEGCCVPICITNIVLAHMRKYNLDYSYYFPGFESADDLFDYIACMGEYMGYYDRTEGGVQVSDIPSYILYALNEMSIGANVVGHYTPTYENIKYHLNDNDLIALRLYNHPAYSDNDPTTNDGHRILCYAYTRIRGTQSGNFKTYLKVADGWYSTPRYIDLSTVVSYENGEYVSNGNCSYVRVEIWR